MITQPYPSRTRAYRPRFIWGMLPCLGSRLQTHGGCGGRDVRWITRGLQQRGKFKDVQICGHYRGGAERDGGRKLQGPRLLLQVSGTTVQ